MEKKFTNNFKNYYWSHNDFLGKGGFGSVFKCYNIDKKG